MDDYDPVRAYMWQCKGRMITLGSAAPSTSLGRKRILREIARDHWRLIEEVCTW